MYTYQIPEPGGSRPGLLGVPAPIMSLNLFGPQGSEQHTKRHKGESHTHQVVAQIHLFSRNLFLPEPEQIDSHGGRRSQHSICKHIYDHMRSKPGTLQSRHQGFVVYLRPEEIDTDKHQCQYGTEGEYLLVFPPGIRNGPARGRKKRIPQPCLSHGTHRQTFQRDPHTDYEREKKDQSCTCKKISRGRSSLFPDNERTQPPETDSRQGKPDKTVPTHSFSSFPIKRF